MIPSTEYAPRDADLIATGDIVPVEGTPFDLRKECTMTEEFLNSRLIDTRPVVSKVRQLDAECTNLDHGLKFSIVVLEFRQISYCPEDGLSSQMETCPM
mgnify:FL=1